MISSSFQAALSPLEHQAPFAGTSGPCLTPCSSRTASHLSPWSSCPATRAGPEGNSPASSGIEFLPWIPTWEAGRRASTLQVSKLPSPSSFCLELQLPSASPCPQACLSSSGTPCGNTDPRLTLTAYWETSDITSVVYRFLSSVGGEGERLLETPHPPGPGSSPSPSPLGPSSS